MTEQPNLVLSATNPTVEVKTSELNSLVDGVVNKPIFDPPQARMVPLITTDGRTHKSTETRVMVDSTWNMTKYLPLKGYISPEPPYLVIWDKTTLLGGFPHDAALAVNDFMNKNTTLKSKSRFIRWLKSFV